MAITQTYLTSAIGATDLTIVVNSGTGFPAVGAQPASGSGYAVRIDKEIMFAVAQPVAGQITVRGRGANGTVASAHDVLAKVEVGQPSDFAQNAPGMTNLMPPFLPVYATLGQDTTFTAAQVLSWGNQPQNFAITKATAAAITLVAPDKSQDGLEITFTSQTAAAHVITATSLLGDAVSGSPHTTATFAAYIGAGIVLQAQNGVWNVITKTGVTIT